MAINTQLFQGQLINLGPINFEKDPEVQSRWTHDLDFVRALDPKPAQPLSPAQVKKRYEKIEKNMDESRSSFFFTVRSRDDDRMLGFVHIHWIEWTHGVGNFHMGIGDPAERGKGYGREALALVLRFAFNELNLYRLSAEIGEDNPAGLRFFERFGFQIEVRRRQSLHRDGKYWDLLHLGLLADEWRKLPGKLED
jgi:hypothetical protein